jgi:hypothetical protein
MVVQHVEPWISDEDIESGGRWNDEVAAELERAEYGIICVTSANLERPWLMFEAGALAKRFEVARVVPLLIDLKPGDVTMPLGSFQGRPLSEDGVLRLVRDMNAVREQPLPAQQIDQLFTGMWPSLEKQVAAARIATPQEESGQGFRRPEDVMAELIETVRRIERRIDTTAAEAGRIAEDRLSVNFVDLRGFAEDLTDAVGQLTEYQQALAEERSDRTEFESLVTRFQRLLDHARQAGLPFPHRDFDKALEKWHRYYNRSAAEDHMSHN